MEINLVGHDLQIPNSALAVGLATTVLLGAGACFNAGQHEDPPSTPPAQTAPWQQGEGLDNNIEIPAIHPGLATSAEPQLRVLGQHEELLGRGFDQMMVFRDIPRTVEGATERALEMVPMLQEFNRQDIGPLVIFEPDGDIRDMDPNALEAFFQALKSAGITDETIGTWVPLPEPNIPEWSSEEDRGNTDAELFKANFAAVATALKNTFPAAKTVLLLNGATWQSHDYEYQLGPSYDPQVLLQYVKGLPKDLVDAVCLQGFAWLPDDLSPEDGFLEADLAIALAKELDVTEVRLNTGTPAAMYGEFSLTPEQRKEILDAILVQAQQVKDAGHHVTIDNFIEDKSDTEEQANWSYPDGPHWDVFADFVRTAQNKGFTLTIFDQ